MEIALQEPATLYLRLDVAALVHHPLVECTFIFFIIYFSLLENTGNVSLIFYIADTAADILCILFTVKDAFTFYRANEEVALGGNGHLPREHNHEE